VDDESPDGTPTPPRKPRRRVWRVRWIAAPLFAFIVFTLGWTLLNRAIAPSHAVTSIANATNRDSPRSDTFRVAAWNIAHARGPRGTSNWVGPRDARLNDIADLIATWNADVVVLNEVDFDCT